MKVTFSSEGETTRIDEHFNETIECDGFICCALNQDGESYVVASGLTAEGYVTAISRLIKEYLYGALNDGGEDDE